MSSGEERPRGAPRRSAAQRRGGRGPRRLGRRLLLGQVLVVAVGLLTLGGVALLVGTPVFHAHVQEAVGQVGEEMAHHLDEAFSTTLLLAVSIGGAAALAAAIVVSWLLASRIARPVEELSRTAERLAAGHLDARAPRPAVDDELAELTVRFNDMAASLEHTEDRRRRLLADVAHELRTPLSTLEGYLEGLADGVVEPTPETWQVLRDAGGRLRRLADDLALVSRAEEGRLDLELAPVDPVDLADGALRAAELGAEASGVALRRAVSGRPPSVVGDEARLRQVLANLLENGIRHSPAGAAVTVAVAARDGGAEIAVLDQGSGIAPADLPHVFERFYRGDAARSAPGGSGIGLTISRAIAHAHGGELAAASDGPGRGTRFALWLPGA